jgi:hypothetical protein
MGEEISADWGHLLAYGIKDPVPPTLHPEDMCKLVRAKGGFLFAAHPTLKDTREVFWEKGLCEALLVNNLVDGFELINAESVTGPENIEVINKYREYCQQGKDYPVIGNSDAHSKEQIGKNIRMYVLAESSTEDHILRAITQKRCVIEWQRRFYGNADYISEVDLWYSEHFIEHLHQCQQEVEPLL